jgi:hypothetical protein
MNRQLAPMRARFWAEAGLSAIAALLAVVTTVVPDWIELLTGADPDYGSGSAEWSIVVLLALASAALAAMAGLKSRRHRLARRLARATSQPPST